MVKVTNLDKTNSRRFRDNRLGIDVILAPGASVETSSTVQGTEHLKVEETKTTKKEDK